MKEEKEGNIKTRNLYQSISDILEPIQTFEIIKFFLILFLNHDIFRVFPLQPIHMYNFKYYFDPYYMIHIT